MFNGLLNEVNVMTGSGRPPPRHGEAFDQRQGGVSGLQPAEDQDEDGSPGPHQ